MDRNKVKWQPFNSVINGEEMVASILNKKNKKVMPTLSEDQINNIEEKIITSYNNQNNITIKYFKNGKYLFQKGIVLNVDPIKKRIIINNNSPIYFSQILEITQ